jgi:hypothetical protein
VLEHTAHAHHAIAGARESESEGGGPLIFLVKIAQTQNPRALPTGWQEILPPPDFFITANSKDGGRRFLK